MLLAVQDRRGRASRVRSADGAAMFDGLQDLSRYARLGWDAIDRSCMCRVRDSSHRP